VFTTCFFDPNSYIKHIVEEYSASLKVILVSGEKQRILNARGLFKKLVCLHTLKYLFESVLEGGPSVGIAYLEKIKKNDNYNTVLEGSISDVTNRLVKLHNISSQEGLMEHPKFELISHHVALASSRCSKLVLVTKHNKVLELLSNFLKTTCDNSKIEIVSIRNNHSKNMVCVNSLNQESSLEESLRSSCSNLYLVTYQNLDDITSIGKLIENVTGIIQVEPGQLPTSVLSQVVSGAIPCVNFTSLLPNNLETCKQSLLEKFSKIWTQNVKNTCKVFGDGNNVLSLANLKSVFPNSRNSNLLNEVDIDQIFKHFSKKDYNTKQVTRIIATEKCIQNSDLISELENRFAIQVEERTSTFFSPADFIVNERHCIVLYSSIRDSSEESLRNETVGLFNAILNLSLQFSYCWVIVENYMNDQSSFKEMDIPSSIASSLLSFTKSLGVEVNIKFSYNMDQTAEIVYSICRDVRNQSKLLQREQIWIRERENAHELFLSHFPSVNFFSAQAILQNVSLVELSKLETIEEFSMNLKGVLPGPRSVGFHYVLILTVLLGCPFQFVI